MFPSKIDIARSVPAQADLFGPLYAGLLAQLRGGITGGKAGQAGPGDDAIALLNALPIAIYMTDAEGRILFSNELAREI
jgi:PAS domain-containing protein